MNLISVIVKTTITAITIIVPTMSAIIGPTFSIIPPPQYLGFRYLHRQFPDHIYDSLCLRQFQIQ